MATLNVINNRRDSVILHAVANGTFIVAGNSTVSNVATGTQVLTGGTITRVWYGGSGHWNIKRGANLVFTGSGSGYQYFDGAALTVDKAANVVVELVGTSNGHLMVELRKEGSGTGTN
jgi:hypothetical protein